MALTPAEAIDTTTRVFGPHPGFRALHAKGIVAAATFRPAPGADRLSRAAHLAGPEVPATVRFSNGAGNPGHPDYAPDPRGLAVKFYLPDGSRTDIVAVSAPVFLTRTPEGFIEFVAAQGAGPAAAWRVPAFFARHPEALRVLPRVAPTLAPPASYATIPYHGLHAFRWTDAQGGSRYVRLTLAPAAAVSRLKPWQARKLGRDYLQREIAQRLAAGPVLFSLEAQIAEPGDPVNDPNAAWPRSRRRVTVGALQITGLDSERERDGDVLVFDPTRVTDGIECSDDPVLRFRHNAYSESVARRMQAR
ncbi:MAG TPA: catalase family peroxidase [Solirubrobacteraceae bacterium]|nr:catalase family peroxidase [Solirubrobacteraceae bacterium]